MTTKTAMAAMALLVPAVLLAAPPEKVDPVAEGYPTWTGVTAKNYVQGRELCPSDLRHKVTIVIDLKMSEKLDEQLALAFQVARYGPLVPGKVAVGK